MPSQDRKKSNLRKRVLGALSLLLLISLASHPELRLLVPFLDAVGLDLFMALVGTQALMFLGDTLGPFLLVLWQRMLPAIRAVELAFQSRDSLRASLAFFSATLTSYSGFLGQYAWARLSTLWRIALLGPDDSFRPKLLRGSTCASGEEQ
jgi:hypothetical protein